MQSITDDLYSFSLPSGYLPRCQPSQLPIIISNESDHGIAILAKSAIAGKTAIQTVISNRPGFLMLPSPPVLKLSDIKHRKERTESLLKPTEDPVLHPINLNSLSSKGL